MVFANCLQEFQRYGAAIDATDVLPVPPHFAGENERVERVVGFDEAAFVQAWAEYACQPLIEQEDAFDERTVGPSPHNVALGTVSQQQSDGIDDDGFSRTSFTCEHIQARFELDADFVDNGKVANGEFGQHRQRPFSWLRGLVG